MAAGAQDNQTELFRNEIDEELPHAIHQDTLSEKALRTPENKGTKTLKRQV